MAVEFSGVVFLTVGDKHLTHLCISPVLILRDMDAYRASLIYRP